MGEGYENEIWMKLAPQFPVLVGWQPIPPDQQAIIYPIIEKMEQAAGLNLPFWPRTLLFTWKALRLDLGIVGQFSRPPGSTYPSNRVADILLTDFPHTLLLIGSAFLLLFLLGIPLALALSRRQGGWLDRLFTLFVPISSIPSWVITFLLILVFSIEVHLLPPGGMVDANYTATGIKLVLAVARHMILPVLAILLSMFFQCVYAWRTYFLIYTGEDYVELAKAKGLPQRTIERRYISRPALPYVITNFALLLVSFWQMTTALEYVINWPGIGRLYIYTMPHLLDNESIT